MSRRPLTLDEVRYFSDTVGPMDGILMGVGRK